MGFFISDEDKAKHGDRVEKHPSAGKYEGLNPERHTTDFIFFIAIFAMWVCMSCVGGYAVRNGGDPYRLLGPINSEGKICGYSDGYKANKYLYTVTTSGMGVCVESCPTADSSLTSTTYTDFYCLPINTETIFSTYYSSKCQTSYKYDYSTTDDYTCSCNI